jgi:hypothetical protein
VAINIDTQDLDNYPGNVKRVSIDQTSVVPQGYEGDEQFMLNITTSAYSDNINRTRIQDYYVTNFKAGWYKSSGFAGTKFALDSTHNSLEVKIDSTTSGISDGYYRIILDHNNGLPIDADVVAEDMETKIRALANSLGTADIGYKVAYLNTVVEFNSSRFWVVSGSLSSYYSGVHKSSVNIRPSLVNDCSELLGFNLSTNSETADGLSVKEALVLTTFSGSTASGTGQITINQSVGAIVNDCMAITNNTYTDYFQITNIVGDTTIYFNSDTVNNDYIASKSKVQLLRAQDPDASPTLWFDSVDKIIRHGIKTMMNQIDYSS